MLLAIGISFAVWDITTVKATNGDLSSYANAKVGDIVKFGRYYQTGNRINNDANAEYEKTPIEWIVVDKDERTGQLTLMSKYILAAGSYFGNWYYNEAAIGNFHYNYNGSELGGSLFNQAYVDSTARAFLNNLERRDLGGDSYEDSQYKTSATLSNAASNELLTSVGFSNRKYYISGSAYQRPINNEEYKNRPATRGFYDEAFTEDEKSMIAPKEIAGYTGFRWPAKTHEISAKTYVEGVVDKVWLPSATELNIMETGDYFTNPSDASSSTVFKYFKNYHDYNFNNIAEAIMATRTPFTENNSKAMNYSIPVYQFQSAAINDDIHETLNSSDFYWTRSPRTYSYGTVLRVDNMGTFSDILHTDGAPVGIRPCVILQY